MSESVTFDPLLPIVNLFKQLDDLVPVRVGLSCVVTLLLS